MTRLGGVGLDGGDLGGALDVNAQTELVGECSEVLEIGLGWEEVWQILGDSEVRKGCQVL